MSTFYEVSTKPLTVNQAWQGRRFKTPKYTSYENTLFELLPNEIWVPEDQIELRVEFGLSNKQQDIDNGLKPLVDILQKAYEFNDNRIYGLRVHKTLVPKGEEFSRFQMYEYDENDWSELWK